MDIKKYIKPNRTSQEFKAVQVAPSRLFQAKQTVQGDLNRHLLRACQAADLVEIKQALDLGANVNCIGDHGHTPLHIGVKIGDEKLVELLLEKGASLTIEDEFKYTPVDLAIRYNHQRLSFIFNIWKFNHIFKKYPHLGGKKKIKLDRNGPRF